MREKVGAVFSIAKENAPVPGCTVSKEISEGENYISVFSLAKDTDISAEIYPYHKLLIISDGGLTVYRTDGDKKLLSAGESIVTETDIPVGMRTDTGAVYTEIAIRREDIMNDAVKAGEVFKLVELVPYQEGKIVNMDVVHNDKMEFVVMAFGEALIFALDGEAVIGYEGEAHPIKAGENFHFAKGGMHSVKAEKKFKMALLLTLE